MIPETADTGKFGEADFALCFAQIEAHYFANALFLPAGHFFDNIDVLASIPIHIVNGRFDVLCPLTNASWLVASPIWVWADPAPLMHQYAGHCHIAQP